MVCKLFYGPNQICNRIYRLTEIASILRVFNLCWESFDVYIKHSHSIYRIFTSVFRLFQEKHLYKKKVLLWLLQIFVPVPSPARAPTESHICVGPWYIPVWACVGLGRCYQSGPDCPTHQTWANLLMYTNWRIDQKYLKLDLNCDVLDWAKNVCGRKMSPKVDSVSSLRLRYSSFLSTGQSCELLRVRTIRIQAQ